MSLTPPAVQALLDAERARTTARLATLTGEHRGFVDASRDTNADDEHDPEGATIAFERSQVGALIRQAQHHLDELDEAQRRLDDATYGVCLACGVPIPAGRLQARPTATTCVACAGRPPG